MERIQEKGMYKFITSIVVANRNLNKYDPSMYILYVEAI